MITMHESIYFHKLTEEVKRMHYIEIGQDIVDAIKGGANGSGKDETTEIVDAINGFSTYFSDLVKMIVEFCKEVYNAIKK